MCWPCDGRDAFALLRDTSCVSASGRRRQFLKGGPPAKTQRPSKRPAFAGLAYSFVVDAHRLTSDAAGQAHLTWRLTSGQRSPYSAASLSFLSARALMRTVAGLAANTCSCLVNGLMPLRLGLAGIFCTSILSKPGSVKD